MPRVLFLLILLTAAAFQPAAAQQDGWQQATPENARVPPPQLRGENAEVPTPRPDPPATWQQAAAGPTPSNAPPPLRADAAPAPMPRPDPPANWQQAASNTTSNRNLPPPPQLRSDGPMPTARPDPQGSGPTKASFPGGINATFDIAYQPPNGAHTMTLDLYQPRPRGYPLPLVVFVHGANGDSRHAAVFPDTPSTLAGLAAQGYVVASVNYRAPGEARFPAAVQDIKTAIRFLRGHAGDMNMDTTRVALWGVSTGGHLAALAGTSCGVALFAAGSDDCVQAVVDWYGPIDAQAGALGCEPANCAPGLARTASPLSYITITSPPFLIEQGAADTLVPPSQSQKLQDALKANNVSAELVIYPEMGQDFSPNGTPDAATVRQALQKMAAFLASVFPPGAIGAKARPPGRGSVY